MNQEFRYAYCSVSDSTAMTADDWVKKSKQFLDLLEQGWEIVSSQSTAASVHYILRKPLEGGK